MRTDVKENKMGGICMVVRRNIGKTTATKLEKIIWQTQA
jgi:hypothetical protein